MSLSIGIVGLPNVGKSTLFNAMLKSELAEAANFAFTTIDPNIGIVDVPDDRLEHLKEVENSKQIVNATVRFVDIAGLIEGAHKGEGLGNKFLSHIREVDAIAMVVRIFKNDDVMHVSSNPSPRNDIETIITELILSDTDTLNKRLSAIQKDVRSGDKLATKKTVAYQKVLETFEKSRPAIEASLSEEEADLLKEANFLTLKPFLYVFNVSEENATSDPQEIIERFDLEDLVKTEEVAVICAKTESELNNLMESDRQEYLSDLGLEEPGLNRLIRSAYTTLGLISFFTAGEMEARAWEIKKGSKAPQAAGAIHGDFEHKFIKAEVVSYQDFITLGGWKGSKEAGKVRLEGKDYVVNEADVIYFHHGK
ncbi:MAG: Ribosome-binding ATPase YchF [candidate division WS2 bacterium ADurb.Bin280]|uniref:Ribosome-binding ATPase YchF n=1 Tax=candidate division WS2 bacterium ADurb.Bin280 TaxID=1852829 RepID=A0A1V5SD89_9BACT|nr:MAG: Ribosome-binding ATPase YchF [candidate division WS2 bacterium ADurb.Bin280]